MSIIALDIGGTKIASAIFDYNGNMTHYNRNLIKGRTGHEVAKIATKLLNKLIVIAARKEITIDGIGICIPGIVYPNEGRVWVPNIPDWQRYPLLEVVKTNLINPSIPVFIESDRTCHLYGEVWQGAAKDCHSAVFVAVGTGIGMGILIDNHLLHGAGNIIGASGWMALQSPYLKEYDRCGCFEYYASGNGISDRAKDLIRADKNYKGILRQKTIVRITCQDVFAALDEHDPIAQTVISKAVEMWGMAAANIVSLLNPQKIIWGGGVFGPATKLIPDIYKESSKWAQPVGIKQVSYEESLLKGNAGLYGAGYFAIKSLENK